jgi:hypothetical protein
MASVSIKKKKVITLNLNEKEAEWLKGLTQNYLGQSKKHEHPENKKIRESIFTCLKKGLENE